MQDTTLISYILSKKDTQTRAKIDAFLLNAGFYPHEIQHAWDFLDKKKTRIKGRLVLVGVGLLYLLHIPAFFVLSSLWFGLA